MPVFKYNHAACDFECDLHALYVISMDQPCWFQN